MQIIPIMPIETMFGMVNRRAGYYIRRSPTDKLYSCRCPDRSRHVKTPAESANQQRFAARYAGRHRPPVTPFRTLPDILAPISGTVLQKGDAPPILQ